MAQTVNDIISSANSVDTGNGSGDQSSSQARQKAFDSELVSIATSLGATNATSPKNLCGTQPGSSGASADAVATVEDAVSRVEAVQNYVNYVQTAAAGGDPRAQAELSMGFPEVALANAMSQLNQAVNNEINVAVGVNADDDDLISAGESLAALYANDPEGSAILEDSIVEVLIPRFVQNVDITAFGLDRTIGEGDIVQLTSTFDQIPNDTQKNTNRPRDPKLPPPGSYVNHEPWLTRTARLMRSWMPFGR